MNEPTTEQLTIKSKVVNESDNPKAPYGFLYLEDDRKVTVWKKAEFENIITGIPCELTYTTTENGLFKNITFNNFKLDILDIDKTKITFTEEAINELKEDGRPTDHLKVGDGTIPYTLFGIKVVIDDGVEEIRMPQVVITNLLEALNGKC